MTDDDFLKPDPHNIAVRACAMWQLLLDLKAAIEESPEGDRSRRCEDIVAAVEFVKRQQAERWKKNPLEEE